MLEELTVEEKLRLVRFMCAFAWADLDVSEREQALLSALIRKLDLPDEARLEAESWIEHPPDEEELDPNDIPLAQRRLFVSAATEIIGVDGVIDGMEVENLALFDALLGGDGEE